MKKFDMNLIWIFFKFEILCLTVFDSQPPISAKTGVSGLPMGQYDEYLSIESPEEKGKQKIKGQYCSLGFGELLPPKDSYKFGEPVDDYLLTLYENYKNSSKHYKKHNKIHPLHKNYFTSNGNINMISVQESIEGYLEVNDYIKTLGIRLPTGLCLPTTCYPKDIEFAINKSEIKFIIS